MSKTDVCVVGLGYIGLPTAAMFATHGFNVVGIDVSVAVVETINSGNVHIEEPGLEGLVKNAVDSGSLRASVKPLEADVYIIAVPTPFTETSNEADLSYIKQAVRSISNYIRQGVLIILESTSPPGTTEYIEKLLHQLRPDLKYPSFVNDPDVYIAHCPERVLPGQILNELIHNDRIIGGLGKSCADRASFVYESFVKGGIIKASSAKIAEMAKLTENSFRDVNIAFANELSLICDKLEMDVWELIKLSNLHPRVNILNPGPGVGGHCIAVDPWFIVSADPENSKIIKTARLVNDMKPKYVVEKISKFFEENGFSKIVCLGLTFKPDVDDVRNSPSMEIFHELKKIFGKRVTAIDPFIPFDEQMGINTISMEAIALGDTLVIGLVGHSAFKKLNLKRQNSMDFCGVWLNENYT